MKGVVQRKLTEVKSGKYYQSIGHTEKSLEINLPREKTYSELNLIRK
jgi:hypothetical protein